VGISYENRDLVALLFQLEGSVAKGTLIPVIFCFIVSVYAVIFQWFIGSSEVVNVGGHEQVGFVLGFLLVFVRLPDSRLSFASIPAASNIACYS